MHDKSDSYDLYVHVLCAHQLRGILFFLCANTLKKVRVWSSLIYREALKQNC